MIFSTIFFTGILFVCVFGAPPPSGPDELVRARPFDEVQPRIDPKKFEPSPIPLNLKSESFGGPPPFFVQLPGGEIVVPEPGKLRPLLLSNGTWALFLEPQNVTIPYPKPDTVIGPPMPPMGIMPPMPRFGGGGIGGGFGGRFPFGGPSPFGSLGRPSAISSIISGFFRGGPFGGGHKPRMGPPRGVGKGRRGVQDSSSSEEESLKVVVGGDGAEAGGPVDISIDDAGSDFPKTDNGDSQTITMENVDGENGHTQIPSPQGQIPMPGVGEQQVQGGSGQSTPSSSTQGPPPAVIVVPGQQKQTSVSEKSVNVTTTVNGNGDGTGGGDAAPISPVNADNPDGGNGQDDSMTI